MFYSQQMVKWDQGGLEWSLPPELRHWQLSSEEQRLETCGHLRWLGRNRYQEATT